jgi:hypothetical protein
MKHRTCDYYIVTPLSEVGIAYPSGAHESTLLFLAMIVLLDSKEKGYKDKQRSTKHYSAVGYERCIYM